MTVVLENSALEIANKQIEAISNVASMVVRIDGTDELVLIVPYWAAREALLQCNPKLKGSA